MKTSFSLLLLLIGFSACHNENTETTDNANIEPAVMNCTVVKVYPHDSTSFTEGLEWQDTVLYESTGENGHSKLARVDLNTGKELFRINFPKEIFGEGITVLNGKLYMLTYQTHKCYVYDFKTMTKIGEFDYEGEGWGMTNDGKYLIMDNGDSNLYYRDPETFKIVKTVVVYDNNGPRAKINELEYVDGFIYSNIWEDNYIVKIDPSSGRIVSKADLTNLINQYVPETVERNNLINGIAYDKKNKRFFITGKNWSKLFEVQFN